MKQRLFILFTLLVSMCSMSMIATPTAQAWGAQCRGQTLHGTIQKAHYTIDVPASWNGTLALYSHGYVFPTEPLLNPAPDAVDPQTRAALLQQGYALAGSSYSANGWALQQAFHDQIALLHFFTQTCGHPDRVVAWGESLGGIITAGLIQLYPNLFTGALPMCGVLAGGVGTWNEALDSAFAFNVLLANNSLQLVHISQPASTFKRAETLLTAAQQTPQGRARIALASALTNIPGWFDPSSPQPTPGDFGTQEYYQYLWQSQVDFAFAFAARAELEARAGGNPSWNTGVDYRRQLALSAFSTEVRVLYLRAGLNLENDLRTLNASTRIQADARAVDYLKKYIIFNGQLTIPVLTMHTTGDGLVVNQEEQAYASVVGAAGNAPLLRQTFIHRAGHCAFTPAEMVTGFRTLIFRINSGTWDRSTDPNLLNQEARALGPILNTAPPAFINYRPTPFLRPYDARNSGS